MSQEVILLNNIQKLKKELNALNEEYLNFYEKMEDLKKEKEYFESLYMAKLGALIFLKFEKEIEYRRLKKKLTLIIQSKNKGEEIQNDKIDRILEEELAQFYKDLENLRENLKNSKEFLELPTLSEGEVKKVKEIFRGLAKILHPDVNKALDEKMKELWLKVKEAYENNDLMALIILQGLAEDNDFKEDIKINSIEENIGALKKKIDELKAFIDKEENEFPLNIRNLIDDEKYIQEKKQELTISKRVYENGIIEIENTINEILGERSNG